MTFGNDFTKMKLIKPFVLLVGSLVMFTSAMEHSKSRDVFSKRLWRGTWPGAEGLEARKFQDAEVYNTVNGEDNPDSDLNYEGIPIKQLTLDEVPLQEEVDRVFNLPGRFSTTVETGSLETA